jgi:nucleotide-binding universal stress UspA family protein
MKRVVLAVDACNFSPEIAQRVSRGLSRLFGNGPPPTVHTVFVLTPSSAPVPFGRFDDVAPRLRTEAKARLAECRRECSLSFADPDVFIERGGSMQAVAERVNDYARRLGAGFVVIPTTRKSAIGRLVLGSFSETMLLHAAVPILTIGPDSQTSMEARRSLVAAIDVTSDRQSVYIERIIDLAKAFDLEIVFLQAMLPSFRRPALAVDPVLIDPRALIHSDLADNQQQALGFVDAVARDAERRGARASSRLLISSLIPSKAIVYAAKAERARLIALASQSTPMSWLFVRSVARDVIRTADFPVWVMPSGAAKLDHKAKTPTSALPKRSPASAFRPSPM